jgi:hypothetical protein
LCQTSPAEIDAHDSNEITNDFTYTRTL